jgi:hypothetical protein
LSFARRRFRARPCRASLAVVGASQPARWVLIVSCSAMRHSHRGAGCWNQTTRQFCLSSHPFLTPGKVRRCRRRRWE